MNGTAPVAFGAELAVTWDELRGQSFILRMVLTRGGLPERGDAAKDPRPGLWERGTVGRTGVSRRTGARNLGRKADLWSLEAIPSAGLLAGKPSVVTVTSRSVSTGSWDQTHVVGGSSWGGGSKSLSQMLDRLSFRLARASWLPREGRARSRPSLSELCVTVVVTA